MPTDYSKLKPRETFRGQNIATMEEADWLLANGFITYSRHTEVAELFARQQQQAQSSATSSAPSDLGDLVVAELENQQERKPWVLFDGTNDEAVIASLRKAQLTATE